MAKSYLQIKLDSSQNALSLNFELMNDILIAELAEIGFDTFDNQQEIFNAYVLKQDYQPEEIASVIAKYGLKYEVIEIPYVNWNREWEKNFSPIGIHDFVYIRSKFHPECEGYEHTIIIQPKMAFGTGHHATTKCMIQMMKAINFEGKQVLDMGTGTGVLAILAEKLGASGVLAADYDEVAVENTVENLELNQTQIINVEQYSHPNDIKKEFDIILANINRNVLLNHLEGYSNIIVTGGTLLLSGFYKQDVAILKEEAQKHKFQLESVLNENEWFCLQFFKE